MDADYAGVLPEIILSVTGVLVMLAAAVLPGERAAGLCSLALTGTLGALVATFLGWGERGQSLFGMVFRDNFAQYGRGLFLLVLAAVLLLSRQYVKQQRLVMGEIFALLLFAAVGMNLMVTSADLVITFLGIELLSIASYVLAGYRDTDRSIEAAWKYFILGAFSTAFLLYGVAMIYGATGSTGYVEMAARTSELIGGNGGFPLILLIGAGLLLVGFGFKAALVPFHVWAPDVYEGAPTPVTAFLAVGSKAAAFLALVRILEQVLAPLAPAFQDIFWWSAVATMMLGNLAALVQTSIKRLLAYSSIAHAGYLLVGLTATSEMSRESVLFYLSVYAIMTLGAFTVVQLVSGADEERVQLTDYKGLGYRRPFLAVSLSVFLISMAGIPATAGFIGKLFLFSAAIERGFYGLVILGLLASAMGVYYYLRVIVLMYMYLEEGSEPRAARDSFPARVALAVLVLGTFCLGLFPGPLMNLIREASLF